MSELFTDLEKVFYSVIFWFLKFQKKTFIDTAWNRNQKSEFGISTLSMDDEHQIPEYFKNGTTTVTSQILRN